MPETWKTSEGREVACEQCGSRHEVKVTRLPLRDRDQQNCGVCGYEMDLWHATEIRTYRLLEAKPWSKLASA